MKRSKINAARRLAVAARKKEQASDFNTGEEASKAKDRSDLKQVSEALGEAGWVPRGYTK